MTKNAIEAARIMVLARQFWNLEEATIREKFDSTVLLFSHWLLACTSLVALALHSPQAHGSEYLNSYGTARNYTTISATTVDESGNTYIAGRFKGGHPLSVGAVTLQAIGISDEQNGFVAKLDSHGTAIWAKNFGGSGAQVEVRKVAVDRSGNVYVSGDFEDANLTTPVLTLTYKGNRDAFVVKLDSSGTQLWSQNFGSTGFLADVYATGLALDGDGNMYLAGTLIRGNLAIPALAIAGLSDAYVLKLDPAGQLLWAKNFGGKGATTGAGGIAADLAGNAYLAGYFGEADLSVPVLARIGATDAFVAKLDPSGTVVWAKNFGGAKANVDISAITTDASGKIYVTGGFADFDMTNPTLQLVGLRDAFVLGLSPGGSPLWANSFGGMSSFGADVRSQAIAVDVVGNVYMAGSFGWANLVSIPLIRIGPTDGFLLRLDAAGNLRAASNFGGTVANTALTSVVLDGLSNLYFAGNFSTGTLSNPPLPRKGDQDAFVLKQTPASIPVIEFYNQSLDHYFITWVAAEVANLDSGKTKGWIRTGQTLSTYITAQGGSSPVCRYYIPPTLGDSHFFGRGVTECNNTGTKNPSFVLEAPDFMNMFLPAAGACPAGTAKVYRVFSNRSDANHRYLTDKALRDQMADKGWLAEGDGPEQVVMCAPQ